jgi:hypothetical protein
MASGGRRKTKKLKHGRGEVNLQANKQRPEVVIAHEREETEQKANLNENKLKKQTNKRRKEKNNQRQ